MYEELNKVKRLLTKYGGHALAAGVSMEQENVIGFRKMLNIQCTLTEKDLTEKNEIFAAFLEFSEDISKKLKKENLLAKTVVISILTNSFEGREYRMPLYTPTDISMTIAKSAMELFNKNNCLLSPLRAVGVRVVNLVDSASAKQLSLFENDNNEIDDIIENNILKIRSKYGKESLTRAICMNNKAKPSTPGFYK